MRILILSSDPIPHIGGKSTHIISLKGGLEEIGHSVKIFSPKNIPLNLFRLFVSIPSRIIKIFSRNAFYFCYRYLKILIMVLLLRIRNDNSIDVINCQDPLSVYVAKKVYKNTPIVLTMHSYFSVESMLDNSVLKSTSWSYKKLNKLEVNSLKYVSGVACVDNRIKRHIQKNLFKVDLPIKTIMNFTDTNHFMNVSEELKLSLKEKFNLSRFNVIILCPRRLVEKNGVIFAVEAMKYLDRKVSYGLIIAGDGPQKIQISDMIKKHGLEDKVVLLGDISNRKMKEIYACSDIVIIPSITVKGLQEATSISAIEAMSCGIPVIASKIGGLKELINHESNGLLVPEKDVIQIANYCNELINNRIKAKKLGVNARDYIIKNNSHISAAERFFDLYKKSIS